MAGPSAGTVQGRLELGLRRRRAAPLRNWATTQQLPCQEAEGAPEMAPGHRTTSGLRKMGGPELRGTHPKDGRGGYAGQGQSCPPYVTGRRGQGRMPHPPRGFPPPCWPLPYFATLATLPGRTPRSHLGLPTWAGNLQGGEPTKQGCGPRTGRRTRPRGLTHRAADNKVWPAGKSRVPTPNSRRLFPGLLWPAGCQSGHVSPRAGRAGTGRARVTSGSHTRTRSTGQRPLPAPSSAPVPHPARSSVPASEWEGPRRRSDREAEGSGGSRFPESPLQPIAGGASPATGARANQRPLPAPARPAWVSDAASGLVTWELDGGQRGRGPRGKQLPERRG